jgi:alpha-1,2-mannosyltransferase
VLPRRILPPGTLTGIVTAVKLTPAIFVLYLVGVRRSRAAAADDHLGVRPDRPGGVPGPSIEFWMRLARGDTGLGHSIMYDTNQSVTADLVRLAGWRTRSDRTRALAVVALLGVWSAVLWHRLGEVSRVTLCGVAGLLASPVSWLHHFVWVVPSPSALPTDPAGGRPRRSQHSPGGAGGFVPPGQPPRATGRCRLG